MKKTIIYMSTKECFKLFQTEEMKIEYAKELESVDITDDSSIQHFLDTEACDIERLTPSQCELLNLDYEEGYYISTWRSEYLK